MSVITKKGSEAAKSANAKAIDFKKVYLRLKDGESVKVRLLSAEDYVEYLAHGSFNKGIFTQPCIEPTGERCALCEAAKYDKDWKVLSRKKRYLFAMYDLEERMIRLFDASKAQATALISTIEEYRDSLDEIAFTFKRTGEKTSTTYTLSPILKLTGSAKEAFDAAEGETVDINFYEQALNPRTLEQQVEELRKAGFPADEVFGAVGDDDEVTPIEDDPASQF